MWRSLLSALQRLLRVRVQGQEEQEEERVTNLPPGYRLDLEPDVWTLYRSDGTVVGRFFSQSAAPAEVERVAWEDYIEQEE